MKSNRQGLFHHMEESLKNIDEFMETAKDEKKFTENKLVRSAVCMELLNFVELVKKSAADGIVPAHDYPWKNIIRLRDRTSHWYHKTDFGVIYRIVTEDLPNIRAELAKIAKTGYCR